jgi:uncharacterized protein (TIGR02996 family)
VLWLEDPRDHHRIDHAVAAWRAGDEAEVARAMLGLGVELAEGALARTADARMLRVLVKAARSGEGREPGWHATRGDGGALRLDGQLVAHARSGADPGPAAHAMLASIAAAPDDDPPRLVLADWLSERDDAMGEVIARSVAIASASGVRARVALAAQAPAPAVERPWLLVRRTGLDADDEQPLVLPSRDAALSAAERYRGHPLGALELDAAELEVEDGALLGAWLSTLPLEALALRTISRVDGMIAAHTGFASALLEASRLPRLRRLALDNVAIAEPWLDALRARTRLRAFELLAPDAGSLFEGVPSIFLAFLGSEQRITSLTVRTPLDERGHDLLSRCRWPLRGLTLAAEPPQLGSLAGAPLLGRLERLDLGLVTAADADAFESFCLALRPAPRRIALHALDADAHPTTAPREAASELLRGLAAASPWQSELAELSLRGLPCDEAALRAREIDLLGRAGLFARAARIDLRHNALGDDGALALLDHTRAFDALLLAGNGIGPDLLRALAAAKQALGVVELDLSHNPLGDEGAAALAATPFHELRRLDLRHAEITPAGVAAVEAAPWFDALDCDPFGRDALA